jgi:hypothetical protein
MVYRQEAQKDVNDQDAKHYQVWPAIGFQMTVDALHDAPLHFVMYYTRPQLKTIHGNCHKDEKADPGAGFCSIRSRT